MLLTKEVDIKVARSQKKYYENLGYSINKAGDTISVKIEDLPLGSHYKIEALCDYCKEEILKMPYHYYNKRLKTLGKIACSKCKGEKIKESNMLHYGVSGVMQLQEVKDKMRKNNIEKYGTPCPLQATEIHKKAKNTMFEKYGTEIPTKNKDILDKIHKTNLKKYGVKTPMESNEIKKRYEDNMIHKYGVKYPAMLESVKEKYNDTMIKKYGENYKEFFYEKLKQTVIEKYGVDNVMKNEDVLNKKNNTMLKRYGVISPLQNELIAYKTKQTNLERYGVDNPLKNENVKKKIANSLHSNGTGAVSKQQVYIASVYNGLLNYPISYYLADIYLPEENIIVEYDGSGHDVSVKYGTLTQEEFTKKEIKRSCTLKYYGYKTMRIISLKDNLPSDEILLEMLRYTKKYFNDTNHTWINYDIDTSLIRNAENKDGVFFDFGKVRKIKNTIERKGRI